MNDTPSQPVARNPWWIIAAVGAIGWIFYLVFFLPAGHGPSTGRPADFTWQLRDLNDQPSPFRQFQGKAVFLNIWATWCPPCVQEMPSIVRLASRPELKDVAFVCVSVDGSGDTVKQFLQGKDWPMTVLRATDAPPVFATNGIPATFIIAPNGSIVSSEVGANDWDNPETIALLKRLAGEQKP